MTGNERATAARLIHLYEESAENGPDAAQDAAEALCRCLGWHAVSLNGKVYAARGGELVVVDLTDVVDVTVVEAEQAW